jgi:hypothetical protein
MAWLDDSSWRALRPGPHVIGGDSHELVVVECGELKLPSGRLVAADPFVTLDWQNAYYPVPAGTYPVRVTIDETIGRELYVSLILAPAKEAARRPMVPSMPDGTPYPEVDADSFYGIPVDAGTVCFVDDEAVRRGMPEDMTTWHDALFDNDSANSWFNLMDNPDHIRAGLANMPLPRATDGANLILSHSGWGDGHYPVVGGYDAEGHLVAVHIDLLVHDVA